MEFRWSALIAVWTMLSGPVFVQVQNLNSSPPPAKTVVAWKASPLNTQR